MADVLTLPNGLGGCLWLVLSGRFSHLVFFTQAASRMKNSPETLRKRQEKRDAWKHTTDPASFPRFVVKVCKDCKEEKPCGWSSTFSQGSGKPLYKARCNDCQNKYLRTIRRGEKHKAYRRKARAKHVAERKALGLSRLGGKCQKCGYSRCVAALTFHHPNDDKESTGVCAFYEGPLKKFLAEVDKCQLLCFNCHMEEHWSKETLADVQLAA